MAISLAAEVKREEEKAKGVNPGSGTENPDIVPFEDNEEEEEEEEEESEEEDDGTGASAFHGRGRGRGLMWPPQMQLPRGARPMPGMGGFPLGVMGADGFPYGPGGFPMSDPFGVAPRPFGGPYGPRFPGMMFPGRPPQGFPHGGFGMMGGSGPGRGVPVMGGGMGPASGYSGRGGRQMLPPPPPSASGGGARDQRPPPPVNDLNERNDGGSDRVSAKQEAVGPNEERDKFDFRNEESGSEDEAPRRSRHGEGRR